MGKSKTMFYVLLQREYIINCFLQFLKQNKNKKSYNKKQSVQPTLFLQFFTANILFRMVFLDRGRRGAKVFISPILDLVCFPKAQKWWV